MPDEDVKKLDEEVRKLEEQSYHDLNQHLYGDSERKDGVQLDEGKAGNILIFATIAGVIVLGILLALWSGW